MIYELRELLQRGNPRSRSSVRPSVPRTIVRPISIIRHGTFQAFLLVPENPPSFLPSFGFNKVQPVRPVHTE